MALTGTLAKLKQIAEPTQARAIYLGGEDERINKIIAMWVDY